MLPGVFLSLPEHTPLARTWLAQVRREAMRVEIEYHDLEGRYRTRELCGVPNDPTEKEAAHALRVTWAALAEETEKVDESLEDVKAKFTEITSTQVKEAATVCVTRTFLWESTQLFLVRLLRQERTWSGHAIG